MQVKIFEGEIYEVEETLCQWFANKKIDCFNKNQKLKIYKIFQSALPNRKMRDREIYSYNQIIITIYYSIKDKK